MELRQVRGLSFRLSSRLEVYMTILGVGEGPVFHELVCFNIQCFNPKHLADDPSTVLTLAPPANRCENWGW